MSLKDMMNKVAKQIEETPIKEKVIQWKDKTMDMVKGVDNPAHYQKLPGFRLFQTPISVNLNDREKILVEQIGKLEEPNTRDCAIRLASILPETEQIKNIIVATMKLPYLIVWTEQDMIIIVCKEHYRRLAREEIHTFKLTQTSPSGLSFLINEWEFTGTDKSRTYTLIRNFCHENTFDYKFQSYDAPVTDFNFVERFKYAKLKKENEAELENKILVKLMETSELPIVSVYGTYEKKVVL